MKNYTTQAPLNGLRVLNTRPTKQGQVLSVAIRDAGGIALDCPALSIVPTKSSWFNLLPDLNTVSHALFTSPNAVTYAFKLFVKMNFNWPTDIHVTAIGKSTAQCLNQFGVFVSNVPTTADSEHILALPIFQLINKMGILLFKGEGGRLLIPNTLKARGADLIELDVYRRTKPQFNQEQLHAWWHNKSVDIILFTSYEGMLNIFSMFGKPAHPWLKSIPCLVISKRLAQAASLLGMENIIHCNPESILNTLDKFNKGFTHE